MKNNLYKNIIMKSFRGILEFAKTYKIAILVVLSTIGFGCVALVKLFPIGKYSYIIEVLSKATTVTISMIGFSISTYVFLNNTLQRKLVENSTETETIREFLKKKRTSLCSLVIWSICLVIIEILLLGITKVSATPTPENHSMCLICVVYICIILTIVSIVRLAHFDYSIINYENGLIETAKAQLCIFNKHASNITNMKKNDFLMLVNNMETVLERISENHHNALKHSVNDSLVLMALCSNINSSNVLSGQKAIRREIADNYKKTIEYRNYILHDESIKDDDDIEIDDAVLSTSNLIFNHVLAGEVLSDISIINLTIENVNFSKTSFRNCSLKGIKFLNNSNLKSTDFRDSILIDIDLNDSDCADANFTNAKLINVHIIPDTKLTGAVFNNADMSGLKNLGISDGTGKIVNMNYANFVKTNMVGLVLQNITFDYCDMTNVQMFNSIIGDASFDDDNTTFKFANLQNGILTKSIISRCDFTNANLSGATLAYTNVKSTNWNECRLLDATFTECKIEKSTFEKSYCSNISMKGAIISNTAFNYATLNRADFSAADIDNVHFDDAVCNDTLFVGASIKNSSFQRSILSNCRITSNGNKVIENCIFNFSNLSNSSISNVEFKGCKFIGCDFSETRLINVVFTDCEGIESIRFTNAWLDSVKLNDYKKSDILRKALRYSRKVDVISNDKIIE